MDGTSTGNFNPYDGSVENYESWDPEPVYDDPHVLDVNPVADDEEIIACPAPNAPNGWNSTGACPAPNAPNGWNSTGLDSVIVNVENLTNLTISDHITDDKEKSSNLEPDIDIDSEENLVIEPIFETFLCPLTKQVMKNPVIIENGQTFEREAIENWFEEGTNNGRAPTCPVTSEELRSTDVIPNIVHRRTINEWHLRNELTQLKIARNSIRVTSSESEIMPFLKQVEYLHNKDTDHKVLVRRAKVIRTIAGLLTNDISDVRCRALKLLCVLAEEDDNKEDLARADCMFTIVRLLKHNHPQEREHAARLLLELSKSESLCRKIGEVNGAILILIGTASSATDDMLTIQKAEETLVNMERCESNVLVMARNGRVHPLLKLFLEGSTETRVELGTALGGLKLSDDTKFLVCQTIGPSLLESLLSENMQAKEMALKALKVISSYRASAQSLIQMGILPHLLGNLFAVSSRQIPPLHRSFSTAVLANLVASGADFDRAIVDQDSNTLISEVIINKLLQIIGNANPAMGSEVLHVLVGLTSSPSSVRHVVDAIKKSGSIASLIRSMETSNDNIRSSAIGVLRNVLGLMSEELATALCESNGLTTLLKIASNDRGISEEQATAVNLLADLPEGDPQLVQNLIQQENFSVIISKMRDIQNRNIPGDRVSISYNEGIVRLVSKLTYIQEDPGVVKFNRGKEIAMIFANLLEKNGYDTIQLVSAKALKNLSLQTGYLSQEVLKKKKPNYCVMLLLSCIGKKLKRCRVHGGICSLKETFCIAGGGVVGKLVARLNHANTMVVDAALETLCTLLEDGIGVDIEQGAVVLHDAHCVRPIVNILINDTKQVHPKSLWAIERLLRVDSVVHALYGNEDVEYALVSAYNKADNELKTVIMAAIIKLDIVLDLSRIGSPAH